MDTDKDGIGNNTDTDDDGDGFPDAEDLFPLDSLSHSDTDGDGIGDGREFYGPFNFADSYVEWRSGTPGTVNSAGRNRFLFIRSVTPYWPGSRMVGYYVAFPQGYYSQNINNVRNAPEYIKITKYSTSSGWKVFDFNTSYSNHLKLERQAYNNVYFYSDVTDFDGDGVPNESDAFPLDVNDTVLPEVTGITAGELSAGKEGEVTTTSGSISITDADPADEPTFEDSEASGKYGVIIVNEGDWIYTLNQSTVQFLSNGDSVIDNVKVLASDGTEQIITIKINGSNDR